MTEYVSVTSSPERSAVLADLPFGVIDTWVTVVSSNRSQLAVPPTLTLLEAGLASAVPAAATGTAAANEAAARAEANLLVLLL
ncbi:hypothetical protein GCM10010286_42170 [Streptomyces toxytricini]|nr:hypothetical protein GCM10010286_42170 [Streptomyces toxytricini]